MRLIQKYYIKEFIRLFAILSIGLSIVAGMIELINRIDDFMPHNPSVSQLLYYILLNIPNYALYTMPVCILLSSLFVMGNAGRRREIVAIRSSGGSIKKLLYVFILAGIILTSIAFIIGEYISPPAMREAHRLKDMLSKSNSKEKNVFWSDSIWLKSKDAIMRIELYSPDREVLKGVSIFRIEGDMLSERIEAEHAEWREEDKRWILRNGVIYDIKQGGIKNFQELSFEMISPRIFREEARKPNEMNLKELINYEQRLKAAGFKNNKLVVDIHSKISYPLINLIMMILGLSIAVSGEMRGGLITAAIGIGISLFYWLCLSLALSMSYTGIIPPTLGPWSIPFAFGLFSAYRFAKIPE